MIKQYRTLDPYTDHRQWGDEFSSDGGKTWGPSVERQEHLEVPLYPGVLYRRPIESPIGGWIPLSERRPTEADADEHGHVLSRRPDGLPFNGNPYQKHWTIVAETFLDRGVYWLPLPKLPNKDAEAFEEWSRDQPVIHDGGYCDARPIAKRAWNAALEYARKND